RPDAGGDGAAGGRLARYGRLGGEAGTAARRGGTAGARAGRRVAGLVAACEVRRGRAARGAGQKKPPPSLPGVCGQGGDSPTWARVHGTAQDATRGEMSCLS